MRLEAIAIRLEAIAGMFGMFAPPPTADRRRGRAAPGALQRGRGRRHLGRAPAAVARGGRRLGGLGAVEHGAGGPGLEDFR